MRHALISDTAPCVRKGHGDGYEDPPCLGVVAMMGTTHTMATTLPEALTLWHEGPGYRACSVCVCHAQRRAHAHAPETCQKPLSRDCHVRKGYLTI